MFLQKILEFEKEINEYKTDVSWSDNPDTIEILKEHISRNEKEIDELVSKCIGDINNIAKDYYGYTYASLTENSEDICFRLNFENFFADFIYKNNENLISGEWQFYNKEGDSLSVDELHFSKEFQDKLIYLEKFIL